MSTATATANPTISKTGSAIISGGMNCTWKTANGTSSTLTITNQSTANTLNFAITGAPASGILVQCNGVVYPVLNGFFQLPPNSPSASLQAQGDMLGTIVTITNNTNTQNNANASIVANTAS